MTQKKISPYDSNDNFNDPFMEKILDAMAQDERNHMSAERTEQMLRKIQFAVMLNRASNRAEKRMKHNTNENRSSKEHNMR